MSYAIRLFLNEKGVKIKLPKSDQHLSFLLMEEMESKYKFPDAAKKLRIGFREKVTQLFVQKSSHVWGSNDQVFMEFEGIIDFSPSFLLGKNTIVVNKEDSSITFND